MSKIGAFLRQHYPALAHPSYVRLLWATAFSSLGRSARSAVAGYGHKR
ncbi:MAG: hypothetical protein ACK40N_04215 [Meiothermus ruber]|jgi:hypothetical protein